MTDKEILKAVKTAKESHQTLIITPQDLSFVWQQVEIESVPHIAAEAEINNSLYGISVTAEEYEYRSHVKILGY